MKSIARTARVGARGLALASLTSATAAGLAVRRRLHGDCPRTALAVGQRWARRSARALGLEITVDGTPPAPGPLLLLANHRSYVDIVALLAQVPCRFLAKAEIGGWPVFGTAARLQGTVFVQRECPASRKAARQGARAALRAGLPFAAFPEGTTFRGPGTLPFFRGLFEVAAEEDAPVVPVALELGDPADAWVDDDTFARHFAERFREPRLRVHLHFGPALRGRCADGLREGAQSWIEESLRAALPKLRGAGAAADDSARPAALGSGRDAGARGAGRLSGPRPAHAGAA